MGQIPVFFCEPIELRNFEVGRINDDRVGAPPCAKGGICCSRTSMGLFTEANKPRGIPPADSSVYKWTCDACGRQIDPKTSSGFTSFLTIYRRVDTGEIFDGLRTHQLPVGACYDATWLKRTGRTGWDGRSLTVVTPSGEWHIDNRASNCTMPEDNEHRCWVRHGRPEDGTLHVDKNGLTCAAGSIVCGNYHGFLHNGHLTDC